MKRKRGVHHAVEGIVQTLQPVKTIEVKLIGVSDEAYAELVRSAKVRITPVEDDVG